MPVFRSRSTRVCVSLYALTIFAIGIGIACAENPPQPKISGKTREEVLHTFNAELVYIRTNFPMGKTGLKLKNGVISPDGAELQQLIAAFGPAVKPGEMARISDVLIKNDFIRFEINGGPAKKQKWYQRVQVNGGATVSATNPNGTLTANAHGSYVDLCFDKYVPELTGPEVKELLRPVFDFEAKSATEAYLDTIPPKAKEAIKNHQVLVGMNQEMVLYAKGRPPRRVREKAGDADYEEWIYGVPPEDVDFVRFVGDEVVRVETMKVNGLKVLRVEREVDLGETAVAQKQEQKPAKAPTLRRPGEEPPQDQHPTAPKTATPGTAPPDDTGPRNIAG